MSKSGEANEFMLRRALADIEKYADGITYVGHAGWPDGRRRYTIEFYEDDGRNKRGGGDE